MADVQRQGPATFSIEGSDSPVGSAPAAQLGVPQVQPEALSPGLSTQQPGVNDANAKTFRAITELASGVLAPKIKEAAQEQYISGVQRAMTGEALGEIIKDQPWYTNIFAPSAALAGARAYTSQTAVAQWAGKIQEQMPQLAKVGPEQLQSAAVGALQGFMTGDPAADAMITAQVTEHMAPLFKQHAKEHYLYMQKVASEAQLNAWDADAKVYNGLAVAEGSGKGTVSPEDKEAAKSRLLGSLVPFADQSDQAYERNIAAFLEGTASAGNFHVVRLFKDTGLYDKIPPDKRAVLDRNMAHFARQALDKMTPQYAVEMAMLINDPRQDPREIPARIQAFNDKVAKATGVQEASMIPPQTVDNIVGNVMRAQRTASEKAADKAEAQRLKEQEKMDAVATAASQINLEPGRIDRAITMGLVKETDAEVAGLAMFKAAKTPTDAAKILNSRVEGGFKAVKSLFGEAMRSEEYNDPGVGRLAQIYAGLNENVKPHYFDADQRKVFDRFTAQVNMGMPPQAAWVMARNSPALTANQLADDPKDAVSKAVRDEVDSYTHTRLGGIIPVPFASDVDDAGQRMIEAAVSRSMKADRGNNPLPVAAKRAVSEALANGVDIQGKHVILNTPGASNPPLFRVVGESQVGTAKAFESLMAEKAKALGGTLDNYEAFRVPDIGGHAYVYVDSTDSKGKVVTWTISSDELKAAVTKQTKSDRFNAQPVTPEQRYTPDAGGSAPIPGL